MTQKSFLWDGASLGDADTWTPAGGYHLGNSDYESPLVDLAQRMIFNGTGNRGVLLGWLNELAVAGVATPVTVDTGGAVVYGMAYENTVSVNVAVPTPTYDTRNDYIVLRRDWDAQTIRITRIAGTEGAGIPALTQSAAPAGSGIYDIPLATLSIDIGGAITVTDAREWVEFTTVPQDGIFTAGYLTNESVDWTARATRTKHFFLGGGDVEPGPANSRFSYDASSYLSYGTMTWGTSVVSEEGWQMPITGLGALATFKAPPDLADDEINVYLWLENDTAGAASSGFRSAAQKFTPGAGAVYTTRTTISVSSTAQGDVERDLLLTITGVATTDMIMVSTYRYSWSVGTQHNLLGFEVEYTGYL